MAKRATPTQRQQQLARAKRRIEARAEIIRMQEQHRQLADRIRAKRAGLKTL